MAKLSGDWRDERDDDSGFKQLDGRSSDGGEDFRDFVKNHGLRNL